jgi:hypothetical protein
MRCFAMLMMAVALLCGWSGTSARAQDRDIDCSAFLKNSDGSWTVINLVFIPVQNVRVRPGTVFKPGQTFLGDDMAERLAKACPNQPVALPPAEGQAVQSAAQPQAQPYVPLSTYADANGNIDIQSLTCAQLALASPVDIGVLVTWYSGWYAGLAKRRGINIARVQYATRNVADYCKANSNQRLSQALDVLLKRE